MKTSSNQPSIFLRLLFPLLIALFIVPSVFAQRTITTDEVNTLSKGLYCPVCESEPLDTCGTQACKEWREEIRAQLSSGLSQEEIYTDFVDRYGMRVLAQPPAEGLNLILWLGIPAVLLIGGYFFSTYMRRISRPVASQTTISVITPQAPTSIPADADDYLSRIEAELLE